MTLGCCTGSDDRPTQKTVHLPVLRRKDICRVTTQDELTDSTGVGREVVTSKAETDPEVVNAVRALGESIRYRPGFGNVAGAPGSPP
ncbi:hypothetical protein [Streptomyces nodosus]|uniref:hypothetical protein n=1 Tax=Streptomyces nodosus TaxID=40318 RepID=UPI001186877F|nr:hypothetical protein [Streptomyces nodosus]MBB4789531.1 hypothetical protein [Streptomyces nodosus]